MDVVLMSQAKALKIPANVQLAVLRTIGLSFKGSAT